MGDVAPMYTVVAVRSGHAVGRTVLGREESGQSFRLALIIWYGTISDCVDYTVPGRAYTAVEPATLAGIATTVSTINMKRVSKWDYFVYILPTAAVFIVIYTAGPQTAGF